MKFNKQTILLTSWGCAGLASFIAIVTTIGATSSNTAGRAMAVAGFIGLASVGSFIVGMVFPNDYQIKTVEGKNERSA